MNFTNNSDSERITHTTSIGAFTPDHVMTWKVCEITLTAKGIYSNPSEDVEVTASFNGPDGITIIRQGFWDGGNVWMVRFAPTKAGCWSCTISNNVNDTGLLGQSEIINCYAPDPNDPNIPDIYKHGFIKVSDNKRYFTYDDNTPFFWLGDQLSCEGNAKWDECNCPDPDCSSQYKHIIENIREKGFTIVQEAFYIGQTKSFDDFVLNCKNRWDIGIAYVAEKGFNQEIWLGFKDILDNMSEQERLLRTKYFVARYGAYPINWLVGGDPLDLHDNPDEIAADINAWKVIELAIQECDSYNHPQSMFYNYLMEFTKPITEPEKLYPIFFQNETFFDYSGPQSCHWISDPDMGQEKAGQPEKYWFYYNQCDDPQNVSVKPLIEEAGMFENIEYIGHPQSTAHDNRKAAYMCIQSGACGWNYGAEGLYNIIWDYDMFMQGFQTWCVYHGNWYEAISSPGRDMQTHLKTFYTSNALPWWDLIPMNNQFNPLVKWNTYTANNLDMPQVKADPEANYITIYYPATSGSNSGIIKLRPNTGYNYRWYNPRNGSWGSFGTPNPVNFTTTSDGTWVVPSKPNDILDTSVQEDWCMLIMTNTTPGKTESVPTHSADNLARNGAYVYSQYITNGRYHTLKVIDKGYNLELYGWCNNGMELPVWLEINFGMYPKTFNQINLYTDTELPIKSYEIQYYGNSKWNKLIFEANNTEPSKIHIFDTVTTVKIRIWCNSGPNEQPVYTRINAIDIYKIE